MTFDSIDAVHEFAGEDYEAAVVPKQARKLLSHFDDRAQHYVIVDELSGKLLRELSTNSPNSSSSMSPVS